MEEDNLKISKTYNAKKPKGNCVWSNFVPQCECWDSVNLTKRGPWHPWEQVNESPPAHCSTSFPFLNSRRKFWLHITKTSHFTHSSLKKQNRSDRCLACPLTFIRCAVSPSGNSQCFQEFLLCTWTSGTSQVGSNSCWNQEPKPTSSGLPCDRKSPPRPELLEPPAAQLPALCSNGEIGGEPKN